MRRYINGIPKNARLVMGNQERKLNTELRAKVPLCGMTSAGPLSNISGKCSRLDNFNILESAHGKVPGAPFTAKAIWKLFP